MGQLLKDRYEVHDIFADSGGMGVIFNATDHRCAGNQVLIKTTRYDGGNNARHFKYTQREALEHIEKQRKILHWEKKILVRLKNQSIGNIPSPNDFFLERSLLLQPQYQGKLGSFELPSETLLSEPYLVMERIAGEPLDKALTRPENSGRAELILLTTAREILTIFIKLHRETSIGSGRGYFIYQDLKPANILLGAADYLTLIDLGAVTLRINGRTTEPTAGCITAGYAAPEAQGDGSSTIDQRFDLYSLGVSLWQLVTGIDPQSLGGDFPTIPLAPLRSANISKATQALIARAIEPAPERRYQSAAEMRKATILALEAIRNAK